ncbi:hypothetical protein P3X46_025229 [Hevea brasiliensis]|uniref:TFIIS N-terminal domain-containing protein n=1 Tax=Hevea brasiliensis TaxID=3981 RepID=A0ABQ9L519_HEVBR|nr:probable mediator of RNA polymerase II transcription subunit 26c [Hevea brasiliensis]KAJ9159750.1 hypothetical protein P3X46_025229 [Hevea brasiliensis]
MDIDDFRWILEITGVDVWTFIDTAILVASLDFGADLKQRRDMIVEMLCALSSSGRCRSMGRISDGHEMRENRNEAKGGDGCRSGSIYGDEHEENDDELDPFAVLFDDKQKKILEIIQHLENPDQSQDSLVDLLQTLADMDMTFEALKDTGIGRHVSSLRKHSSDDVRRLVKQLVRKWREIVDEWLRLNPQEEQASSTLTADGNSPQQKISRNQVPDIAYSPNTHKESSDSDKKTCEPEGKPKPVPRKEAPRRPTHQSVSVSHNVQRQREQQQQREREVDYERLASASKRLQENYKEALNAKKQRTIQVIDIHDIPKPKIAFFAKNKGGGSLGRHY